MFGASEPLGPHPEQTGAAGEQQDGPSSPRPRAPGKQAHHHCPRLRAVAPRRPDPASPEPDPTPLPPRLSHTRRPGLELKRQLSRNQMEKRQEKGDEKRHFSRGAGRVPHIVQPALPPPPFEGEQPYLLKGTELPLSPLRPPASCSPSLGTLTCVWPSSAHPAAESSET